MYNTILINYKLLNEKENCKDDITFGLSQEGLHGVCKNDSFRSVNVITKYISIHGENHMSLNRNLNEQWRR